MRLLCPNILQFAPYLHLAYKKFNFTKNVNNGRHLHIEVIGAASVFIAVVQIVFILTSVPTLNVFQRTLDLSS